MHGSTVNGEDRELNEDAIVSMNFWGFTPRFFGQLEERFSEFLRTRDDLSTGEFYIPTAVDELITAGEAACQVLATTARWFGVTYPADKPVVVETIGKLVEAGEYPSPLGT